MICTFNGYEAKIIWKLHRHHYYGGKHTSKENLTKGFSKDSGDKVSEAIDSLISKGIIIVEKKTKEDHVVLNKEMKKTIGEILKWYETNISMSKEVFLSAQFQVEC